MRQEKPLLFIPYPYRKPTQVDEERILRPAEEAGHMGFTSDDKQVNHEEDGIRDKLVTGVQTCALPI